MFPRPSEITSGRTTALTSKVMVEATTLELFQASPQDGGRCSELKVNL